MKLNRKSREYKALLTTFREHGAQGPYLRRQSGERDTISRAVGKTTRRTIMKRLSAFAAAAFVSTAAQASPPDPESKQADRMRPYVQFVTTMHDKGGASCCNLSDGRMGDGGEELKEERTQLPDGTVKYRVFVTRDIFGKDSRDPAKPEMEYRCDSEDDDNAPHCASVPTTNHDYDKAIPPEGKWFDIPAGKVLTSDAKDIKECFAKSAEKDGCAAPPDNILWLSTGGQVYCYWPIQQWSANVPRSRYAMRLEP